MVRTESERLQTGTRARTGRCSSGESTGRHNLALVRRQASGSLQWRVALGRVAFLGLVVTFGGCASTPTDAASGASSQRLDATAVRAKVAAGWGSGQRLDVRVLASVWSSRAALQTDDILRSELALMEGREAALPKALRGGLAMTRAKAAWRAGNATATVRECSAAMAAGDTLTAARARLLAGFVAWQSSEPTNATRHWRVGRRLALEHGGSLPAPGWLEVLATERLWSATMASEQGDIKAAIDGLLAVPRESSRWAMARRGLALAQLDGQRVDRTLKILGLLPGGWAGVPSRSLIAAVALNAIGQGEASSELATAAQAKAVAWTRARVTATEVLTWWSQPASPDDASFVAEVARQPSPSRLARELLAARSEGLSGTYVELLERRLEASVAEESDATRAEAGGVIDDLGRFGAGTDTSDVPNRTEP